MESASKEKQPVQEAIDYCKNSQKNYEIIVIDDGSQDETFRVANSFCSSFVGITCV